MTSNVIVNFGSNAAALFKDMNKVKSEMRSMQKQALVSTKASMDAMRGAPATFKQSLGAIRFGAGIITGFLGINVLRELFEPIKAGFGEVVKASSGFTFAMQAATQGLTAFGAELARLVTGKTGGFLAQGIADVLFPGMPRLEMLAAASSYAKQNAAMTELLTGEQYTSPATSQYEPKMLELAKRQLQYVRDTATSLRKIENDLDRMNMLDPW